MKIREGSLKKRRRGGGVEIPPRNKLKGVFRNGSYLLLFVEVL